jgi:uncharacterized membrane protein
MVGRFALDGTEGSIELEPQLFGTSDQRRKRMAAGPDAPTEAVPAVASGFGIRRAIAKTITFRIIVTTLDFTANYMVIGELGTAAGLSAFALVVGPVFYFVHEAAWHSVGPSVDGEVATAVVLSAFGFVVGPFVYMGHEMAWDRFDPPGPPAPDVTIRPYPAPI